MADTYAHHALQAKVAELEGLIRTYEAGLEKARRDLATINAAIVILGSGAGLPNNYVPGASVRHLFRKDEAWIVCREALRAAPDSLNTRELATLCLASKDFDVNDAALRTGMQATMTGIPREKVLRREVMRREKREAARVWRLNIPDAAKRGPS